MISKEKLSQKRSDLLDKYIKTSSSSAEKRIVKQLNELDTLIRYIETDPNEEYLKNVLSEMECQRDNLNKNYGVWLNGNPGLLDDSKTKSKFRKETGLKDLEKRIKTLRLILEC